MATLVKAHVFQEYEINNLYNDYGAIKNINFIIILKSEACITKCLLLYSMALEKHFKYLDDTIRISGTQVIMNIQFHGDSAPCARYYKIY